ncbi:MAG TPA: molybdopterin cofactor-binding domain-containing protein [Casimicrobiaceae bacterium]|nr:molybdopterin cofactor-binding domain-containing protein [Casimicrobiaceae bacterium]
MKPAPQRLPRRAFLARAGALVVTFSLASFDAPGQQAQRLPGSLDKTPLLDAWIRVGADGSVTVFTGKAELGQGIRTALIALAAEELVVAPASIALVTADTRRSPDEAYTAGSHSMQDSGTAIRNAAAQVRELLLARAATRLGAPVDALRAENGAVVASDGRRVAFGELAADGYAEVKATPVSPLKDPSTYRHVGKGLPRVDIPAKVTGGVAYVQDLRLPGMLHARVVCPPSYRARLVDAPVGGVGRMPGVVEVFRDGSVLGVIATHEFEAIRAMRALASAARWATSTTLPQGDVFARLQAMPSQEIVAADRSGGGIIAAARTIEATYTRAYQMHGSIGPSCAIALLDKGTLTVWTHSQGVYPLRAAIAEMLRMPPARVQCVHVEGAGCYGHNAADDAAAYAALFARAVPGRPIRLQWMREQEHAFEPYGSAMVAKHRAGIDASGNIVEWSAEGWSGTHSTRPGGAGNLMPAWYVDQPFRQPVPKPIPLPEGGGDRNAIPIYTVPALHVVHHFVPEMPLRISALRSLGAYVNVFAIESFMDELARAAGTDPVAFRLRHLADRRARDVVSAAATRFGWEGFAPRRGHGRGFAFARYKNLAAYCAVAVEVALDHETGRARVVRAAAAVDSGQAVDPDGIRNQIEGAIVQSTSWTLFEAVRFDASRVTSVDWATYPIARFADIPDRIDVDVIDRPGEPFLGTGEAAQGPAGAAIANAIAHASDVRLRDVPLTRDKIKAAIGV